MHVHVHVYVYVYVNVYVNVYMYGLGKLGSKLRVDCRRL